MVDSPQRERDMKLPRVEDTKTGRFFTKYDPAIALAIVERIADGELLIKITAKDATPLTITKQTFMRWVATVPELSSAYSAAMQISAHSFEEKAIDKAEKTAAAPGTPQNVSAASLLISQYRWSAARRNPTRYSDKGNTQIVVPININTTLDLGNSSKQTTDVEVPDIYTFNLPTKKEDAIEGDFEEVDNVSSDAQPEALPLDTAASQAKLEAAKKEWAASLRVEEPVDGTKRQPLLQSGKTLGRGPGPRKRVLTPRASRHPISDKIAAGAFKQWKRGKKDGDAS